MKEKICSKCPPKTGRVRNFHGVPVSGEIPGVSNLYFLKAALNTIRKDRGLTELDAMDFLALIKDRMKLMEMDDGLLNRPVNTGFSGGEKKAQRNFQMAVLEPKLAILDETDSGLDIDALQDCGSGVNRLRNSDRAIIVVTHYQRILNYITPDYVHVLAEAASCGPGTATLRIVGRKGYAGIELVPEVAAR